MSVAHAAHLDHRALRACKYCWLNIIITGRTTLKVLNVRENNKIGDVGILMISEELQHNSLTVLSLENCGLSVKGENFMLTNILNLCNRI